MPKINFKRLALTPFQKETILILIIGFLVKQVNAQDVILQDTSISSTENISANSVTLGPDFTITGSGSVNLNTNSLALKGAFFIISGGQLQLISDFEPVSVQNKEIVLPTAFEVKQNYPNPFNPSTQISYALPKAQYVEIVVYNLSGQVVKFLLSEHQNAGNYTVTWDGTSNSGNRLSSGIYYYRISAGEHQEIRKMTLIK
jgi:hypothetical protein